MAETKSVTVEVSLNEDSSHTEARAILRIGDQELSGEGLARRNPDDPNVPVVGEELATARALADLSHQLVETAAKAIEGFVGRPVKLEE
ncbi:MAG: DUF1876 domain-containing protein [Actinomycetota bacterium]